MIRAEEPGRDMSAPLAISVCLFGRSRLDLLALSSSHFDPKRTLSSKPAFSWYRVALAENSCGAIQQMSIIEEMIASLNASHKAENVLEGPEPQPLLNHTVLDQWSGQSGLARDVLYDALALELASGFNKGTLDFDFCDRVVNELMGLMGREPDLPPLFWDVYLAFDAGEFYRDDDRSINPVDRFTRPRIAEIVRRFTSTFD